jgi:hypothetical protein
MSRSICSCSQAVYKPVWRILLLCVQWKTSDDGQGNCPKHVDFYSKNKFEKLLHLVGFIIRNLLRCTVTWTSKNTFLTCICLRRRLFRVTLEISRTAPWYRDVTPETLTSVWARVARWVGGIRNNDESTGSCIYLRLDLYMSHVKKYNRYT